MKSRNDAGTIDLFDLVPKPPALVDGALGCGLELRAVLAKAIKRCGLSRYAIAARMSELLGVEVTKTQLDAWTAESREGWRFPFEYAAAFEQATGCYDLLEMLASQRGCLALRGDEALVAELGRVMREKEQLKNRERELRKLVRRQV